jgi:predicted enzyme related to lactoylglutathione lyase
MTVETHELRIALTVDDWEAAVEFYRAVLGQDLAAHWTQPAGNVGVFDVSRATLEILDQQAAAGVDALEAGRRVAGPVRLALGVADSDATTAAAEAAGAVVIGAPKLAPWGDRVARVEAPHGMLLTLFSES